MVYISKYNDRIMYYIIAYIHTRWPIIYYSILYVVALITRLHETDIPAYVCATNVSPHPIPTLTPHSPHTHPHSPPPVH